MTINLTLPQLNADSLKDQIITLLVDEKELSAKEIHSKICKNKSFSYQAAHKALQELTSNRVIEKTGAKYKINIKWISELKQFAEKFENKSKANLIAPQTEQTIVFEKLYYFLENMLHLFSSDILFKDCDHSYGGGILTHLWWPLSFDDENYKKFIHMASTHDSYLLIPSNSPVDHWLKTYYEKVGFKGVILNADYKIEDDLAIVGDYLIYVFLPPELKKRLNELYSNPNMSDAIHSGILETILMEKTNIKVTIIKNKTLVKQYWERILPYFGKKPNFK
ncbi:MAG: hypothetical protein PHD05_04425 [Sphaerochaetaceae bacterium]|nr:hypothetical protein [Sphaerochaetaceae bacterium]